MRSLNAIVGPAVYLDANTLIYAVENVPVLGDRMRALFQRIDAGELRGVTSEPSLAETLVKPLRDGARITALAYERLIDPAGRLGVVPVSRPILVKAAELRAAHAALKLPDAIHAATALLHGCTTFLANDARFHSVSALPVLLLSAMP
jgi:predicted nucleic acid-binding protein